MTIPGLRARQMLEDLQRSDFLPPWDEEGMRIIATELNEAGRNIDETPVTGRGGHGRAPTYDDSIKGWMNFNLAAINRDLRCANW
jgi:hypothetical protein